MSPLFGKGHLLPDFFLFTIIGLCKTSRLLLHMWRGTPCFTGLEVWVRSSVSALSTGVLVSYRTKCRLTFDEKRKKDAWLAAWIHVDGSKSPFLATELAGVIVEQIDGPISISVYHWIVKNRGCLKILYIHPPPRPSSPHLPLLPRSLPTHVSHSAKI